MYYTPAAKIIYVHNRNIRKNKSRINKITVLWPTEKHVYGIKRIKKKFMNFSYPYCFLMKARNKKKS